MIDSISVFASDYCVSATKRRSKEDERGGGGGGGSGWHWATAEQPWVVACSLFHLLYVKLIVDN